MAILKRCCCWRSVRKGSFASGIFTMCFYSFHVCTCILQFTFMDDVIGRDSPTFVFVLLLMLFSGLSVLASLVMLIGLCIDNRYLLLPWVVCVGFTTLLDVLLSFCILADALNDLVTIVFFVADYIVCALNIYCLLCVISQYQELMVGRGRTHTVAAVQDPTAVGYHEGGVPERNKNKPGGHSSAIVVAAGGSANSQPSLDMTSTTDPCSLRRVSGDDTKDSFDKSATTTPLIEI
ncbi:uncharacterized protein LOC135396116 [Ornithodoros turicata]|uniref:uncharacterized protein LOC135396116 n=1 Tax=Ornithodoros turicata TaxID=34597 RepID=UPI00313969AE